MSKIQLTENTAVIPTPDSGKVAVYAKSNGKLYSKDDAGVESQLGILPGTPVSQTPDQTNAEGVAETYSKSDHVHNIPTVAPVAVGNANAEGVAASFSRSDHVHEHGVHTNPLDHAVSTTTEHGFLSNTDKAKLDGVANGATANQTDAFLLARGNHTGTQTASSVSDFSAAADARIALQRGATNGLASLESGKIPGSQLPSLAISNVFVVASQAAQLAAGAQEGDIVKRTDLTPIKVYVHNGGILGTMADFTDITTQGDVQSVNTMTGAVSLTSTNIPEGTNLYYTEARVNANAEVSASTAARHTHSNKALLDTYTQTELNLSDAVAKKHAHANAAVLDATTASFLTAQETKLAGIATGATANQTDAFLLARANHTGFQTAASVSDFNSVSDSRADGRIAAQKGVASGLATLGTDSKLTAAQDRIVTVMTGGEADHSPSVTAVTAYADERANTFDAISQAAMLALSAKKGDIARRTDESKCYRLTSNSPSTLADWKELITPSGAVPNADNQFKVTYGGSGLMVNVAAGRARFEGTFYDVAAGTLTVGANVTNGRIYVDIDGVVKSGASTPAGAIGLYMFTSNATNITVGPTEHRVFLAQSRIKGTPVSTGTANAAGTNQNYAASDHVHNTAVANQNASATDTQTTLSTTFVDMPSMTLTVAAAGTYFVAFNSSIAQSKNNKKFFVVINAAGVEQTSTERFAYVGVDTGFSTIATNGVVTVNAGEVIKVQWKAEANTSTAYQRSLTILRLG